MASSEEARRWWTTARSGTLTPWSLAKVWALHTVSKMKRLDMEHTEIAKCVKKAGAADDGDPHPTPEAIKLLRKQFDDDPGWYPGKGLTTRKRPNPKPRFT